MSLKIDDPGRLLSGSRPLSGSRNYIRLFYAASLLFILQSATASLAIAQVTKNYSVEIEPEDEGIELLQSEPYDLIRFKASAGGGWVKVRPLDFPGRNVPQKTTGTLAMNVLGLPGKTYEAKWTEIESIELWEDRLTREATDRINTGDFAGAFPFISILYRDNPGIEKFESMRRDYLLRNAKADFQQGDLRRTLAILEELRRIAPNFQTNVVLGAIGEMTDRLMRGMMESGNLEDAQKLLARLEQDYTAAEVSSISTWNDKFLAMAEEKREQAIAARDAENWREARQAALDSIYLYPKIGGGNELVKEIDRAYPLVNVGVFQSATILDPTQIDNWPARRTGRLVYRALFEMQNAGSEGGLYKFLFGEFDQTPDRMELQLEIQPQKLTGPLANVNSFTLGDRLVAMALRDTSTYQPSWAATLGRVSVPNPLEVGVFLKRPHVLPQSLLQVKVDGSWAGLPEGAPTGAYAISNKQTGPGKFRFELTTPIEKESTQPREIVEIQQDDPRRALSDLRSGKLDVLDHLFPADAARLEGQPSIRVAQYPLPTVHMLIPVSDNPYLSQRDFRRALVYGIDRQDILKGELLGNTEIKGCRVISGPFPAGVERDDPLAYAYDENILPRQYQPRVAALLKTMTETQLKTKAEKDKEQPPVFTPLRLGFPQDDLARIACQAIAQQLSMVGIPIELVELPTGVSRPTDNSCDLVYSMVALWEPITDARRVLGPEGLAGSKDQLVGLGLRRLERARRWDEVRERLLDLHSIVHHELPVIPLWQMVDSYAYRTSVYGLGTDIVTLYQNVDDWRLRR